MPKERNKAESYREKASERKGIRVSLVPFRVISGFRFV